MSYTDEQLAKLHHEVGYGREVEGLLRNELFQKVINDSLHGIQNAWLSEVDKDQREALWHQGSGLQAMMNNLNSIVQTGKMAFQQLEFEKRLNDHGK